MIDVEEPREPHPYIQDVQERVEYLADLMAQGKYVTRTTCRELQQDWELSASRLNQLRESAAAVMRASLGRNDELRTKALATLDTIRTSALRRGMEDKKFGFRWFEVALNSATGMLAFTNREHDEQKGALPEDQTPTRFIVEVVSPERPKADEPTE